MENELEDIFKFYLLRKNDSETLKSLKSGEVDEVRVSAETAIDEIIKYGLDTNLLKKIFSSFPDPRKMIEVPIDVLLLPQVIQNLSNETGIGLAPQMINNSDLLSRLGYAVGGLLETDIMAY